MKAFITTITLAIFALGTVAQSEGGDRKVSIDITINEDGEKQRIKKDFELKDGQSIEDALRELGVLEELGELDETEHLEIDIRRRNSEDMLRDMHMSMFWNEEGDRDEEEKRAFLGVYLEDGNSEKGVAISDVIEGTAAEKAGLKKNDVITSVDGTSVRSVKELVQELDGKEPGEEVKIAYLRDGKKQNMKVELGEKAQKKHRIHDFAPNHSWMGEEGDNDVFVFSPKSSRAFLGVEGSSSDEGVELDRVIEGTSAEKMGLREGDVVTTINGQTTDTFSDLSKILGQMKPGEKIALDVLRDDRPINITGKVGERAEMRWNQHNGSMEDEFVIEIPDLPDMSEFNDLFTDEDREMLRHEMKDLMEELRELKDELRGTITREMHISIKRTRLSDEERTLLQENGVDGLDRELTLDDFQCSPNPSNGQYTLSFSPSDDGDISVDVFNSNGERVRQEKLAGLNEPYRGTVDLTEQGNGTYFLVITQNGRVFTEKLVKQ